MLTVGPEGINLDYDKLTKDFEVVLARVILFCGLTYGIQGNDAIVDYKLPPDRNGMQWVHLPEGIKPDVLREVRRMLSTWVIVHGVRDLVEALAKFLDDPYRLGLLHQLYSKAITEDEYRTLEKSFIGKNLMPKAVEMEDRFGVRLPFKKELGTFHAARNCLAHRLGIVGAEDAGGKGYFELQWVGLDLQFQADSDQSIIPLKLGDITQESGALQLKVSGRNKRFPLGAAILLEGAEMAEILGMFAVLFAQLKELCVQELQKLGITVVAPEARP